MAERTSKDSRRRGVCVLKSATNADDCVCVKMIIYECIVMFVEAYA